MYAQIIQLYIICSLVCVLRFLQLSHSLYLIGSPPPPPRPPPPPSPYPSSSSFSLPLLLLLLLTPPPPPSPYPSSSSPTLHQEYSGQLLPKSCCTVQHNNQSSRVPNQCLCKLNGFHDINVHTDKFDLFIILKEKYHYFGHKAYNAF